MTADDVMADLCFKQVRRKSWPPIGTCIRPRGHEGRCKPIENGMTQAETLAISCPELNDDLTGMCPHCGAIVGLSEGGLTTTHDWPKPTRQVCPGSQQNPRCAESDHRPLWNGKPNPHLEPR